MTTVEAALEEHRVLRQEHETLQAELDTCEQRAAQLEGRCGVLEAKLAEAEKQRDYYMRFATEVVTNLTSVKMTIEQLYERALEKAHLDVSKSAEVPKQDSISVEEAVQRTVRDNASSNGT